MEQPYSHNSEEQPNWTKSNHKSTPNNLSQNEYVSHLPKKLCSQLMELPVVRQTLI